MRTPHIRSVFIFALAVAGLAQCKKEEPSKTPPVAVFKLTPASGLTTTLFQFDATESKASATGDTILFIRWDWDNDNTWDTGFSRARKFTHRYYKPGNYVPRMEIRNEAGLSDTIQTSVQVARGYSPPRPAFTVSSVSGNLRTEFVCDAGQTRDDEDSLNTLKFRWDWEGDGIYNTEFSGVTVASHYYTAAGVYSITLEVIDPTGLSATVRKTVTVSTSNPKLVPMITWKPDQPTTSDTVLFNASSSYDPDNPDNSFTYRWNFNGDNEYDTEYSGNPVEGYRFQKEGENQVVLEIRDQWGLINQAKAKILIAHSNTQPKAAFLIGCEYGNLTTNFYFDGEATTDAEDYADLIKVRWDFENDGIWDTEFAKVRIAYHKYPSSGKFRVKMQAMDSGGLTDTTSLNITVTDGANETGLILDMKNNIHYGTVKIGTQWWMSENLNEPSAGKLCYGSKTTNCATYGALYTWPVVMNGSTTEKAKGLCPPGWHIPSQVEMQRLLDFYPPDKAKQHLEVTGDSDFRLLMAGQKSILGQYELLNMAANFWTSTKTVGDNAVSFEFLKDQDAYYRLNLGNTYGFSVRCIKD